MELVTRHDLEKLNFNMEGREFNSVSDFMRIYLKILQLAFLYHFISEKDRDAIAGCILNSIKKVSYENEVIVSNYVYIISMRFLTISNYECWEILRKITCISEADNFILETREWFEKRIQDDIALTISGYKKSLDLKNKFINGSWNDCLDTLKLIAGCLTDGTKFELKSSHNSCVNSSYTTIHEKDGITFLDNLENYIRNLEIEISILNKLNAKALFKEIAKQRSKVEIPISSEVIEARKKYDISLLKLDKVRAYYENKLHKISLSESEYDRIYDEFAESHSDMDEDEFEDAFDEYWMSCPEYCEEDYSEVEEEYRITVEKPKKEVSNCRKILDNAKDSQTVLKNTMVQIAEDITLLDILNEYAIVSLFKDGKIAYPETQIQKTAILLSLSTNCVIKIFLENESLKLSLTTDEVEYLAN